MATTYFPRVPTRYAPKRLSEYGVGFRPGVFRPGALIGPRAIAGRFRRGIGATPGTRRRAGRSPLGGARRMYGATRVRGPVERRTPGQRVTAALQRLDWARPETHRLALQLAPQYAPRVGSTTARTVQSLTEARGGLVQDPTTGRYTNRPVIAA